ncbi:hypothetical protein [Photorhabdus sp. CRCIA-P01]|uniref:hypothetical protein n=1 Tax=Photorhabdus sp. CRCIA-P01 TaxID=2019570 RepID=UPI000E59D1EF|nr:hypothetical protein [Photorhabdus sp. CRCIA-P01]
MKKLLTATILILSSMIPFFSIGVKAAGSLQKNCQNYIPNTLIDSVNILTNLNNTAPGINISVNGKWYSQYITENDLGGAENAVLAQLAILAYEGGYIVNVCTDMGSITGIELVSIFD